MLPLEAAGCSCCVADGREGPWSWLCSVSGDVSGYSVGVMVFSSVWTGVKTRLPITSASRISGVLLLGVETPICSNWALMTCRKAARPRLASRSLKSVSPCAFSASVNAGKMTDPPVSSAAFVALTIPLLTWRA